MEGECIQNDDEYTGLCLRIQLTENQLKDEKMQAACEQLLKDIMTVQKLDCLKIFFEKERSGAYVNWYFDKIAQTIIKKVEKTKLESILIQCSETCEYEGFTPISGWV